MIKEVLFKQLNFLDVSIIVHSKNSIETDIFYKETNSHDYLLYYSAHPEYCKNNVPFNLAKLIIVFVFNEGKVSNRLKELRNWLRNCKYPR